MSSVGFVLECILRVCVWSAALVGGWGRRGSSGERLVSNPSVPWQGFRTASKRQVCVCVSLLEIPGG